MLAACTVHRSLAERTSQMVRNVMGGMSLFLSGSRVLMSMLDTEFIASQSMGMSF